MKLVGTKAYYSLSPTERTLLRPRDSRSKKKDGWRVAATKLFLLLACDTRRRLELVLLRRPLRDKTPPRSLSIQVRSWTVVECGVNVHPHADISTAQVRRSSSRDLRQPQFDQQRFEPRELRRRPCRPNAPQSQHKGQSYSASHQQRGAAFGAEVQNTCLEQTAEIPNRKDLFLVGKTIGRSAAFQLLSLRPRCISRVVNGFISSS